MQGWLPISIRLGKYPNLLTEAIVRWMQFGDKRLTEPFFRHSVEELRERNCPGIEIDADIASIVWEGSRNSDALPSGFIFHISRCGSTLICNALRILTAAQVVAEASSITTVFMPQPVWNDPNVDECWNRDRNALAQCLLPLFSSYRTGQPAPTVVKFASQNSLCMSAIRALWPEVPCLFIIRDPVEVMVSNLKGGALNRFPQSPAMAYAMCGADASLPLAEISVEDFSARVLGRYLDAAINNMDHHVRIIDYEDINEASVHEIVRIFNLAGNVNTGCLDGVFNRYSKDPTGSEQFRSDRAAKQRDATAAILTAAHRWAVPQYTTLRSLSQWKCL